MGTVNDIAAFGTQPQRRSARRRGWIRIALGTLLLLGGIVVMAAGVVQAVEHRDAYAAAPDGEVLTATGVLAVAGGICAGLAGSWLAVWGLISRRGRAAG